MAVTEITSSQYEEVTARGRTLTRIFNAAWEDWYLGNDDLPVIGEMWPYNPALTVSHIRCDVLNETSCQITTTYSSESPEPKEPDNIASWEFRIRTSGETASTIGWYQDKNGNAKNWRQQWIDAGNALEDDEDPPELVLHIRHNTFEVTAYGTGIYIKALYDATGTVNSAPLLSPILADKAKVAIMVDGRFGYIEQSTWSDVGHWLLSDVQADYEGSGVYKYSLIFEWDPDGWNIQHGITIDRYQAKDHTDLLSKMRKADEPRLASGTSRT